MKRISILLVAVLALVLAACGSDQTDPTPSPTVAATPTPQPTVAATPEPTQAGATDDGSGSGPIGELDEMLPDEVGGLSRLPSNPQMTETIRSMLSGQMAGMEDADFAFATYGQGELIVTAFAAPGASDVQLQMLAQLISSSQVEGTEDLETEDVNIGGKDVLRLTVADESQSVFLYIMDGAFFSVVTASDDLAAELLSQLP